MLIGLAVFMIDSPFMASVSLLEVVLLLGTVKSGILLPILVSKLSIQLWLLLLPKCYGFNLSFITWELMFLLLCKCIVTIRLFQSLLIAIPCSMSILNNQP